LDKKTALTAISIIGEKRKTKLSLCLTNHYPSKTYGGMDAEIHVRWISANVGGEFSPSRSGRFTPGKRAFGTHWI
jgi:hypothetical protein